MSAFTAGTIPGLKRELNLTLEAIGAKTVPGVRGFSPYPSLCSVTIKLLWCPSSLALSYCGTSAKGEIEDCNCPP